MLPQRASTQTLPLAAASSLSSFSLSFSLSKGWERERGEGEGEPHNGNSIKQTEAWSVGVSYGVPAALTQLEGNSLPAPPPTPTSRLVEFPFTFSQCIQPYYRPPPLPLPLTSLCLHFTYCTAVAFPVSYIQHAAISLAFNTTTLELESIGNKIKIVQEVDDDKRCTKGGNDRKCFNVALLQRMGRTSSCSKR